MSLESHEHRLVSRIELMWLCGAMIVGSILRLAFPGRIAIEHFDEAVYASNLWFGEESNFEYPARFLYAPPLLPMAIEWGMIAASTCGFSPAGFVPMLPNLIAGIATIPSLWWISRRWFGPSTGIVAAWLVAASDFHASYSRTALTDVPVCLLILWGVYFGMLALQLGKGRDLILAGLFTGFAWSTKYSGWLPLAILLAGGAAWQITTSASKRNLVGIGLRWLIITTVACAVWSPVLYSLQRDGGYSAVARNHRQYVVGIHGWCNGALRQLTIAGLYDNWIGVVDELWIAASSRQFGTDPDLAIDLLERPIDNATDGQAVHQSLDGSSTEVCDSRLGQWLVIATPLLLLIVGLTGCLSWIARNWCQERALAGWLLIAWICGLSVSTPIYQPYPRLALPWLIAVWIAVGLAVEVVVTGRSLRRGVGASTSSIYRPGRIVTLIVGWVVVWSAVRWALGTSHSWQDRGKLAAEFASVASEIKSQTKAAGYPSDEAIVYVLGEPAVVFALKASGLPLIVPVQNLSFLKAPQSRPTFFVHSARARRSASFETEWNEHQDRFEPLAERIIRLSHLVVLDENANFVELNRRWKRGELFQISRIR